MPVPLRDEFRVQQPPLGKVHVAEKTAVLVAIGVLRIVFEPDDLPLGHGSSERGGFFSEVLDGLLRMNGLRGIHTDQADRLRANPEIHLQGVAIDDSDDRTHLAGQGEAGEYGQ